MSKSRISKLLSLVLVAIMALSFGACNKQVADMSSDSGSTTTSAETTSAATEVIVEGTADAPVVKGTQEGATYGFHYQVVNSEGKTSYYDVYTEKATVGEALQELGMISGEESEYGLYVTVVNGETADYDEDSAYWAFYIDGEYAMTGVDATNIVNGSTYKFAYESAADMAAAA